MLTPVLSLHPQPVEATERTTSPETDKALKAAAQGFEALFITQVLKSARSASFGDALGESSAMDTTRSLLDLNLADAGAERGGLGIAQAVYRQFAASVTGSARG